jgi:cholesterol transport system auxiliary component
MNNYRKIGITCALLLASCSVLSPVKTSTNENYLLNPHVPVAIHRSHPVTLLVTTTESNAIYNTSQMAYSLSPHQVTYFAKSRWADIPSRMLQQSIIQTLQNTHFFAAVVSSSAVGNYNYILNTQLLELTQDFTQKPSVVRMSVRAEITRASNNQIIAVKQFNAVETAPQDTPCGGVVAANRATADILQQLSSFTLRKIR